MSAEAAPWATTRAERFWDRVFSTPGVPGHTNYMLAVQVSASLGSIIVALEKIHERLDALDAPRVP